MRRLSAVLLVFGIMLSLATVVSTQLQAQGIPQNIPRKELLILENPEGTIKNAGWFNIWAINAGSQSSCFRKPNFRHRNPFGERAAVNKAVVEHDPLAATETCAIVLHHARPIDANRECLLDREHHPHFAADDLKIGWIQIGGGHPYDNSAAAPRRLRRFGDRHHSKRPLAELREHKGFHGFTSARRLSAGMLQFMAPSPIPSHGLSAHNVANDRFIAFRKVYYINQPF